jgi:hypothetical protein
MGRLGMDRETRWAKTLRLVWYLESGDWELLIRLVGLAPPLGGDQEAG